MDIQYFKYGLTKYDNGIFVLEVSDENMDFNMHINRDALVNVSYCVNENGLLWVNAQNKVLDIVIDKEFSKDFVCLVEDKFIKKHWLFRKPYVQGWFFYKQTKKYETISKNFQIIIK